MATTSDGELVKEFLLWFGNLADDDIEMNNMEADIEELHGEDATDEQVAEFIADKFIEARNE